MQRTADAGTATAGGLIPARLHGYGALATLGTERLSGAGTRRDAVPRATEIRAEGEVHARTSRQLNRDGFASFFQQRYGSTAVLLVTMGASRADAEDAVQEAMIAAWQKWETIREPAAWVRTTAIRRLWKTSQQPLPAALPDDGTARPVQGEPDPAVFSEEQQRVLALLRQLPPAQRVIAALYYDGLTAEEIASATGKPAATVRSHLRHARRALKEVIASDRSTPARPDS